MTSPVWQNGLRLAGRYQVRKLEGVGPLGDRYLALDVQSGLDVVLRALDRALCPDEAALAAFRERTSRARALSHPGLIRIHDVVRHAGREATVVERVSGRTAAAALLADGPLPWSAASAALHQVGAAVRCAHQAGLVLGDLRPTTVVLTDGGPRVVTVGVARRRALNTANDAPLYQDIALGRDGDE